MSAQRRARRQADRHSPIRKARATKQSASGDDRIASAGEIAEFFRMDCRGLRDSLQLEMVVAQYVIRMRDTLSPEGMPLGEALAAGVTADLERHGDPLSHAILRALAHLDHGIRADRASDAVARLAESGVELPRAFADVGQAAATGAWREIDREVADQYALFAEFEYPRGTRHALALFVEPRHGGTLKHIGLMHPMSSLAEDDPFHPSVLEPLEIEDAGALLRGVLDRSFPRELREMTDDYRVPIAFARAGAMTAVTA